MKKYFSFAILIIATAIISGCGNDDGAQPSTPGTTNGTVTGTVSPATAASQVYLLQGSDTILGTPTSTGAFSISNVTPGSYTIGFNPNSGFVAPGNVPPVVVTAGGTTNTGTHTFTQLPPSGTMSVNIDGTATLSGPPSHTVDSQVMLYLINFNSWEFSVYIPNITAPGTYTAANSNLKIEIDNGSDTDEKDWIVNNTLGSATLQVTSLNTTAKKGTGTLTFTAVADTTTGATGTKTGSAVMNFVRMIP